MEDLCRLGRLLQTRKRTEEGFGGGQRQTGAVVE